ncbi:MAG: bifunctional phosphopantothenoylcysteine decarboxylase/phosphopantothenate--cysteine ligase CoaBC [Caldilineae bacterium]|nr:MAG: bifunctional phosphopantothenoylcysteine decarboxylase/phosphopantothenate--cysteine ligase CoaBC [Caldilineae bacterium]
MTNILSEKTILLGVTGGIAIYKAVDLCSKLVQQGADVHVLMTHAAQKFITPLTFGAISGHPPVTDLWQLYEGEQIGHVTLAHRADLFIIAPLTAHTMARLAQGMADGPITATALSSRAPLLVAPAMEHNMWEHPATQANLSRLKELGATVVGPERGHLASGGVGMGRMAEPFTILEYARIVLGREGPLSNLRVTVTAGGTREWVDPVRFMGNRSSGKMGVALARVARDQGAKVNLVHGAMTVPPPIGVNVIEAIRAEDMLRVVLDLLPETDVLISAAAIADFRPVATYDTKLKKEAGQGIQLERTPDVLKAVAEHRRKLGMPRLVVGFAAETTDIIANARAKMEKKNLEMIVLNDVTAPDAGFGVDTNRVTILTRDGAVESLPLMDKEEVAFNILHRIRGLLGGQSIGWSPGIGSVIPS